MRVGVNADPAALSELISAGRAVLLQANSSLDALETLDRVRIALDTGQLVTTHEFAALCRVLYRSGIPEAQDRALRIHYAFLESHAVPVIDLLAILTPFAREAGTALVSALAEQTDAKSDATILELIARGRLQNERLLGLLSPAAREVMNKLLRQKRIETEESGVFLSPRLTTFLDLSSMRLKSVVALAVPRIRVFCATLDEHAWKLPRYCPGSLDLSKCKSWLAELRSLLELAR